MARYKTKLPPKKSKQSFPVWLGFVGVSLVLMVGWALLRGSASSTATIEVTGAPSIKVDQESFDYGTVKLGEKPIRTVVKVTNVGDQELKFTEAPYIEVLEGC